MMGFGYLGNGGVSSSSPSNLSPLAPPFTVDRSNMKSNSNFTETPSYGVPFSSSLHNWQYPCSSVSRPDFFTNCDTELDGLHTSSVPSGNEYCYLGSEPINPPSTHWATPNPNTTNLADDPFSYPGGPKQYYPSYASQVVDNNASMVGLNEVNYELLSSSGLVPVVGSSHGDYSQGLSSLEFPPPWGGFWSGLPVGKHGKRTDADGSFDLEETDFPGPHAYRDYLKQVAIPECLRCEETHNITHRKYGDVLGSEKNAGYLPKEQFDDKLGQNLGVSPIESSNAPIFGTTTMLTESRLEPVTFSSNFQMSYSPYEKGFQLFDPCINDCTSVTMTSLMPVIRQPAFGTKMPASDTIASKSIDIRDAADFKKDGSSYNQSIEKEPLLPPTSEDKEMFLDGNHLSFHIGRNDQRICASASSKEMLTKPLTRHIVDNLTKVRGVQVPDINIPHGFMWSVDSTEAFKHTSNSTEVSDHHNQGEDSPCWKGAPSSNISPFETTEVMPPQNLMKKLEVSNSLSFQVAQMFPPYNDSVIDACEASGANLQKESLSTAYTTSVPPKKNLRVSFPIKEQSAADDARSTSDSVQLIRSDRDQYLNNIENPIKEYDLLNVLKSDSGSIQSQTKQQYPKELNFTSKSKVQLQAGAVDEGISTSDTSEDGCIPLHAVENVLCSPPSEEEAGKPHAVGLVPKINIKTLASTLHNLSELLLLYSSHDEWALMEQDSRTLEHAISNISVCLSTKSVQSTQAQESLFPKTGISHIREEGSTKVGPQVTNEVNIATLGQLDSYSTNEQKKECGVSDKNLDVDVASSRTDADTGRHHNVVQNIKKVLDENFPLEGDILSETLLYKNLWLDAEAELCFTGINSRFDRVKIQMENCKSDKTKEKSMVVETVPSSILSPDSDLDVASGLTPETNDIPKQKPSSIHYSSIASPISGVNDVEASIMARLQILKRRGDNSSNVEENPWPNVVQQDVPWQIVGSQSGNKTFDAVVGSRVQRHSDNSNEKNGGSSLDDPPHEATEEFNRYLPDDPSTVQLHGNTRLHNQLSTSSGWYENSASDWEHVVKDDFAWQK